MDIPLNLVNVTLADADPKLVFNQFTVGSNSMHSIFTPVRVAAREIVTGRKVFAMERGDLVQPEVADLGR